MFIIDNIIEELVTQGLNQVKEGVSRNEIILKTLRKLNLKPNAPNDFEGVFKLVFYQFKRHQVTTNP